MSVPAPGLSSRWFARPLMLAVAVLLALFVAAGFLSFQYLGERRAVNLSLDRSRQVLDTLDRLRTIIADVEFERRGYLLTLDPAYLKAYGVSDESVRRETQALQTSGGKRSIAEPSCFASGGDRFGKAARDRRHRRDSPHVQAAGAGDDPHHG